MLATYPDKPRRPPSRRPCQHCGAAPGACRSSEWLSGRRCCADCPGSHEGGVDAAS